MTSYTEKNGESLILRVATYTCLSDPMTPGESKSPARPFYYQYLSDPMTPGESKSPARPFYYQYLSDPMN